MSKKSVERIESARALLAGAAALKDKKFSSHLETALKLTESVNSEIETLKVKIEKKKNELCGHIENLGKQLKKAKKYVKKNLPKKSWKSFGVL
ncbi:MAG: hypothetical protein ABSG94_02365 [Brevinematales bacterium]